MREPGFLLASRAVKFRVALVVYWLALIAATHYPSVRLPEQVPNSDKIVHFAAFGGLAFVCWLFVTRRAAATRGGCPGC